MHCYLSSCFWNLILNLFYVFFCQIIANNFDSIFTSDSLSPTNTNNSKNSKNSDKDILSEAMEEIVEFSEAVDDDHLIGLTEQIVPNPAPVKVTNDDDSRGQSSSDDNGQCICIPFDPQKNPEEIVEYLKSQGFHLIESGSEEVCLLFTFVSLISNI